MLSWTKMSHPHATNTNFNERAAKEPGLQIQICPECGKRIFVCQTRILKLHCHIRNPAASNIDLKDLQSQILQIPELNQAHRLQNSDACELPCQLSWQEE